MIINQTKQFPAKIEGIDLSKPITSEQKDEIDRAMSQYGVLIFPNQVINDIELFAFATQLGPIESASSGTHQDRKRLTNQQINDISNLDSDGQILKANDRLRMSSLGNQLWHSDSSYKEVPAKYSMLHARVIPPMGGETEFADMRVAWDHLPLYLKKKCVHLICDHSMMYSRAKIGFHEFSEEEKKRCTPVTQRLVRRQHETGRLSLYLSAHIGKIHDWLVPESLIFIQELTEFATQREFVYQHVWQVHDLVMWDNRSTMHRGKSYESLIYPRDLRRVTLEGKSSTLTDIIELKEFFS
ncbi:MAG: TauD/TfdA family dioxygenase [Betaproteobacteria bacterium]|nr:TauD/TfdA family dioxygenase [Betaproteobacteria bacterium]NBT69393.1 TauD/TfdA family dioxygenase [Betaproteobacteria bacterium]